MADWRLFTERDFKDSVFSRAPAQLFQFAGSRGESAAAPRILADHDSLRSALRQLRFRVTRQTNRTRFEHRVAVGPESKTPRNHQWRTYSLAEQGGVLGMMTFRASEAFNLCEVDVFLAAEIPGLNKGDVIRQMLLFLLTDSVRTTGRLKIQFTAECFQKRVPPAIVELAAELGVAIRDAERGRIDNNECRDLFARLTGFSDGARSRLQQMCERGDPSVERVCYLIHSGVWTLQEVEFLLAGSPCPHLILTNRSGSSLDLLATQAQFDARSAILGEYIARTLSRRESTDAEAAEGVEEQGGAEGVEEQGGYERRIRVGWNPECHAQTFRTSSPTTLPGWHSDGSTFHLPANRSLIAVLRPYGLEGLETKLRADILKAGNTLRQTQFAMKTDVAVVVAKDFALLPDRTQNDLRKLTSDRLHLLVCPKKNATIASEVRERIRRGEFVCQ